MTSEIKSLSFSFSGPLGEERLSSVYVNGEEFVPDEVDIRIEAAVTAERERATRLCEALRYRMNASDFDTLIVAVRKGADP